MTKERGPVTGYWGKRIRIRKLKLKLQCDQPGCLGTRQTAGSESGDGATPCESGFNLVGLQVGAVGPHAEGLRTEASVWQGLCSTICVN